MLRGLAFLVVFAALVVHFAVRFSHLHLDDHTKMEYGVGKTEKMVVLPSREDILETISKKALNKGNDRGAYDILVIGLGATGAGVALDAQSRNLSVLAVDQFDFSSGTSSRSTKLLHGGVRYLKKAMLKPASSYSQWKLVREALHERWVMFQQSGHLTNSLRIIAPVYNWKELAFTYLQMKLYDWISYPHIHSSYYVSKEELRKMYPTLSFDDTHAPIGAVAYYDGQFDDARFNLAVVQTAIQKGAHVLNYAKVVEITHDESGIANGAVIRDENSGKTFQVRAKQILNAGGAFSDEVRKMDSENAIPMLTTACGSHIVLEKRFSGLGENGLLISKTSDKRVLFVLPWQGKTLVGTTDTKCGVTDNPRASEAEIQYLLDHINMHFNEDNKVSRKDVLSSWSGIRPLKKATDERETAAISREHVIFTAKDSRIKSVIGGKWTTYRKMAEEVVDVLIADGNFTNALPSSTNAIILHGGKLYNPEFASELEKEYDIESDVAFHLNEAYGDQSTHLLALGRAENALVRLVPEYPYLEAEVIYAIRHEYALHPIDFLERRIRLSMLDSDAAQAALPRVVDIFAKEIGWTSTQKESEKAKALEALQISVEDKMKVHAHRN